MSRSTPILAATAILGLLGCEADRQAAETTPGFDAPEAIEQAPATPITAETMEEIRPDSDTANPLGADTVADTIATPPE